MVDRQLRARLDVRLSVRVRFAGGAAAADRRIAPGRLRNRRRLGPRSRASGL